jgi:hypothetical protein
MLAAIAIGALLRALKSGRLTLPWTVPARWRPLLALALGIASAVAESIVAGTPWRDAMIGGVASAALAALGHGVLIEGVRNGRELGVAKHDQPPKVKP